MSKYTIIGFKVNVHTEDFGVITGSLEGSHDILRWNSKGECSNKDPDYQLVDKPPLVFAAKKRIKKKPIVAQ